MKPNISLEMLEDYLEGIIDQDQKLIVEQSLLENQELREEFELLKLTREAIAMAGWKDQINSIQTAFISGKSATQERTLTPWQWVGRIAASLLFILVASAAVFLFSTDTESLQSRFTAYQVPVMRGENDQKLELEELYQAGDFEAMIELRAEVQSTQTAQFLLALAYLESERYSEAEEIFLEIERLNSQQQSNVYADQIDFYLIETLIGKGDFDAAENRVSKILSDEQHTYQKNFSNLDLIRLKILSIKK